MKYALVQMNPTVGALEGNTDRIISNSQKAFDEGARLIIFPELAISGYPPEDLILKDHFTADCEAQLERLKTELPPEATVIIGSPISEGGKKYNAAIVFKNSKRIGTYKKILLPNYGVFDEKRLFEAGTEPFIFELDGQRAAIHICEDSWNSNGAAVASLEGEGID